MSCSYSKLITIGSHYASEPTKTYQYITERHLQAMWLEQKYFKKLTLPCSTPVIVLSPGIWNSDAGPDFLKAHVKIGEKEYHGDIEIHLNDSSWEQHQHHEDPRYNSVILHVSLWKPLHPHVLKTKNNNDIFSAYLENHLTISPVRIVQLIDLDLYPYRRFVGSGRCAHDIFKNLSADNTTLFFRSAAQWRLIQKRNYLKAHIDNPSIQLLLGIAAALGYKKNSETFLNLFLWLKSLNIENEEQLMSYAMKASGLFEDYYHKKWRHSEKYLELQNLSNADITFPKMNLDLHQIRPYNHPIRRMAALAKLLVDKSTHCLYDYLLEIWNQNWHQCYDKKSQKLLHAQLCSIIPDYTQSYWNHHFTFETTPQTKSLPLIGTELKNTILINTLLPIIYESITQKGNHNEIKAFDCFFASLSAIKSSKTRYLIHRFFGDSTKGTLLNHADTEQGAYQLHYDFCVHYEASCEGCPFVDRFKNNFNL